MPRGRFCRMWSRAHMAWKIFLLHGCWHASVCLYTLAITQEPQGDPLPPATCSGSKLVVINATIDPASEEYPASNCIDGNTNGMPLEKGLCSSAPSVRNPTLKLELESVSVVSCVQVSNRQD
eukprot:Hpha_TRINITY_DN9213_c0_g1::TRINITY_DN9213_c0_g1_i1::g.28498::m.28498